MQASEAAAAENQIAFAFMSDSDIRPPQPGMARAQAQAVNGGAQEPGIVPIVAAALAAGALVLALVASPAGEPLLLTVMAVLAMLGLFAVFGYVAGHIRIGERVRDDDLIRAFANSLDDGLIVTRRDGRPLYANKTLADLVGVTAAGEVNALETLFAGDPKAAAAYFRLERAASRREPWREEIEIAAAAGRPARLLRVSQRPCYVPGHDRELGQMVLWTISDVTAERARQASAVETLEATLERMDSVPAGLMEVDSRGVVRRLNATLLRWLGIEPQSLSDRGLKITDIVAPEGAELIANAAAAFYTHGQGVDLDVKLDKGASVPLRFFARRDNQGGLLIAAFRREASAADGDPGAAEIRFARFFQSAPFGIATVGADGRLMSTNAAFARMIPDGSAAIGAPAVAALCKFGDTEMTASVETAIKQAIAGTVSPTPIEITVGSQNEFSRRLYLAPLTQAKDAREAAILYLIDATEQKALEAKFAQSSKMEAVGKLAGGIAHDFNNVLTAIIGFSDLLLQTHRPTDPAHKDIMNIRSSATRAAGLVAKLLAFSRRQTLQTEPLQLGEVLGDLAPLLKRSIGETIDLKMPSGRDLWYVKTDRTQFEQVVINLAVNARDAMPEGGTLSITTRNVTERDSQRLAHHGMSVGEYVLIEVSDTGSGMPPEVMAKIFEPFFTTKGVGKGTGLGLSTVYGIVKQTGGFIYPESTPGHGTTFRVYLPRYLPDNEDELVAQKTAKKERPQDLTGSGRVLLVEDEDVVRSFAVRALKRQGYEVLEASTGVEALELMEQHEDQIDLVVSDVVMPEMDGPTLLKELRKKNPHLKIIFVSGYPHEAFETSLDKNEQFAFLPKPFSLPQLAAKVKEQLAR
ncbi:MAG: response regulator [Hyphomicrobium zavarzinii]|uniref:hybrid sensor histidine kinase/response regulator n=1 Tax=Hyphomicrobium zavarzinii TaxID=48292 RepID=UPI001A631CFF|nr:PAS domain-containing sensor histidine kinase [Hyphomicrobium zavarzinii]MBL8846409.1 response regulator [Hyphomicrobium zavarzinii]